MKKAVLYICDPHKAVDCDQTGCMLGLCKLTTHPEWAACDKDGKPIATTTIEMDWMMEEPEKE